MQRPPQRTRHASLDFPRSREHRLSTHDEWGEFLSASMLALTHEDEEDETDNIILRSIPNNTTELQQGHKENMSSAPPPNKQRRDSFSDTSSGSSPAGSVWRPLGRRASSHVVPTNQLEHSFDASLFVQNNKDANCTPSFRDVVNAALSSSESSLAGSTSSYEGSPRHGDDSDSLPAIIDMDPAFAAACLPAMTVLPTDPRTLSVDTRSSPVMLARSPVIGNRRDSQTWQLQEEEMLTSPRFGSFRASLDDTVFSARVRGLGDGLPNNQIHDSGETEGRVVKDSRATSVDFTFSGFNPPLPPPQEPIQRLRARSFSYSAASYNPPFANKQFAQQHPTMMHQFRGGPPPPQPPQPSIHQGLRPPRVSIPPESPMPPPFYQGSQPQPPYRRYSTDFSMPPHPDMPLESEGSGTMHHRTPPGRGVRSYSVEYVNFATNARMRSQSMEGNQLFPPGGPLDYMSSNHSTNGVTYEWPNSPHNSPVSPPLPPDTRSTNCFPPPPPEAYYEIEFKRGRTELFAGNAGLNQGAYVKVEADRGEDIGKVGRRVNDIAKYIGSNSPSTEVSNQNEDPLGRIKRHDLPVKKVIGLASPRECEQLADQRKEEEEVFEMCKSKVRQRLLPMNVIDAEYQFDRHKLTFFFEADRRIDFRELVRDLFAIYKTRIWLQQVISSGKKSIDFEAN